MKEQSIEVGVQNLNQMSQMVNAWMDKSNKLEAILVSPLHLLTSNPLTK
jgi:hypothetical protein